MKIKISFTLFALLIIGTLFSSHTQAQHKRSRADLELLRQKKIAKRLEIEKEEDIRRQKAIEKKNKYYLALPKNVINFTLSMVSHDELLYKDTTWLPFGITYERNISRFTAIATGVQLAQKDAYINGSIHIKVFPHKIGFLKPYFKFGFQYMQHNVANYFYNDYRFTELALGKRKTLLFSYGLGFHLNVKKQISFTIDMNSGIELFVHNKFAFKKDKSVPYNDYASIYEANPFNPFFCINLGYRF